MIRINLYNFTKEEVEFSASILKVQYLHKMTSISGYSPM